MQTMSRMLFAAICLVFAGHAAAQPAQAPRINSIQLKNPSVNPNVAPATAIRVAPLTVNIPPDAEAMVQAEIKRQQKIRDQINATGNKVWTNYLALNATPATGNNCVDEDSTWNPRSGQIMTCSGRTTCGARSSRWSKNKFSPCEAGVTIDSCIVSEECKKGSLCDTGVQKCVAR